MAGRQTPQRLAQGDSTQTRPAVEREELPTPRASSNSSIKIGSWKLGQRSRLGVVTMFSMPLTEPAPDRTVRRGWFDADWPGYWIAPVPTICVAMALDVFVHPEPPPPPPQTQVPAAPVQSKSGPRTSTTLALALVICVQA